MYNRWLSRVAFAYKKLPGELLNLPWTHFLLMALPLQEHECNSALWTAVATHTPEQLSKMRDGLNDYESSDDDDDEDDYEENFSRLKKAAAEGGVLL